MVARTAYLGRRRAIRHPAGSPGTSTIAGKAVARLGRARKLRMKKGGGGESGDVEEEQTDPTELVDRPCSAVGPCGETEHAGPKGEERKGKGKSLI